MFSPYCWPRISVEFHLITNLLSVKNLSKRSSHSASRACKTTWVLFLQETFASHTSDVSKHRCSHVWCTNYYWNGQQKKVLDFRTTKRLLDSVRYDAPCVLQTLFYPKTGTDCPRNATLFILFYTMSDGQNPNSELFQTWHTIVRSPHTCSSPQSPPWEF
jgi:hypothetical protein